METLTPLQRLSVAGTSWGFIGGTTGMLGFFVSTLLSLARAVEVGSDAQRVLDSRRVSFESCLHRYRDWQSLWKRQGARPDCGTPTYWSSEDEKDIVGREDIILEYVRRCFERLGDISARDINPVSIRAFGDYLGTRLEWVRLQRPVTWYAKASLPLWKNEIMKDTIKQIQDAISELEITAFCRHRRAFGYPDGTGQVKSEEIAETVLRVERTKSLTLFLNARHRWLSASGPDSLLAWLFSHVQVSAQDLTDADYIPVDMLASEKFETGHIGHKFTFTYSLDCPDEIDMEHMTSPEQCHVKEGARPEDHASLTESLQTFFCRVSESVAFPSEVERAQNLRATRAWRARAALGVAMWVSVSWGYDRWRDLCSCSIRMAAFEALDDRADVPAFYNEHGHSHGPDARCHIPDLPAEEGQHLMLGILLAELAICQPVSALSTAAGIRYSVKASPNFVADTDMLEEDQLLVEVYKSSSAEYVRAVQFCLLSNRTCSEQTALLRRYKTEVIAPLRAHLTAAQSREVSQRNRYARWKTVTNARPRMTKPESCRKDSVSSNDQKRRCSTHAESSTSGVSYVCYGI